MNDDSPASAHLGGVPENYGAESEDLLEHFGASPCQFFVAAGETDARLCPVTVADEVAEEPRHVFVERRREAQTLPRRQHLPGPARAVAEPPHCVADLGGFESAPPLEVTH